MPKASLSNGLTLHYQQLGSGPDLVMIHGVTGNLAIWHLQIAPLLIQDFRILTYDLRGHGYSDLPPVGYTVDDMAGDLLGLLDALEIERPFIVGHSFGADIGLYFAYRFPERVRNLLAIEPALPALSFLRDREDWEGWDSWGAILAESGHPVPSECRTDLGYLARMSAQIPKQWGPLNGLPRKSKPLLRLLEETSLGQDFQHVGTLTLENIPRIETPVALMFSEKSPFLGTHDYLREHLPDSRSILLPSGGWDHFGPLEQPGRVIEYIREIFAATP